MEKYNNIVGDPDIQKLQDKLVEEEAKITKFREEMERDLLILEKEIEKTQKMLIFHTEQPEEVRASEESLNNLKIGLAELKEWQTNIKDLITESHLATTNYKISAEKFQKKQNEIKETIMKLQPGQEN